MSARYAIAAGSGGPMLDGWWKGELAGSGTVVWEARRLLAEGKIDYELLGIDEPGLTALLQEVDAIAARNTSQNAPEP